MDEAELDKIFDPFYRVEQSSYIPGTGLGLFIAQKFMESLDGKITVDSVKGAGTTFTMILDVDALQKINRSNLDSSKRGEHAL
jgi:signal transduction histidine kinase